MTRKNPFAQYEEWGEDKVRYLLSTCRIQPTSPNHNKMSAWLALLDTKRASMEAARLEEREKNASSINRKALEASIEANSLASKANLIASDAWREARRANTIAIIAMIFTGIIAIIANSDKFIWFLQWLRIVNP